MGCKVFSNENCGLININQKNIRKMVKEQKTNNIAIHINNYRNYIHINRRYEGRRNDLPVAFFVPLFRNRSNVNKANEPLYRRRNYSPRNRTRERNDSQPISINPIPRENIITFSHDHSQRNELESNDNLSIEQNEIDSNNKYEEDILIVNFGEVEIKSISKLEESHKTCAICLEKFNTEVKIIILPCIHIFHRDCINDWIEKKKFCPLCKFELTKENIYQKNAYILKE